MEQIPKEHEEIIKKISSESLHIARLPPDTKKLFIEYSQGFCGDYGMALKQLLDFTMVFGPQIEGIHSAIGELHQRLETVEGNKTDIPKVKKTLGGREIGEQT